MSVLYSNLKQIGAHPGLGVPIYGIGVAASVPLEHWLQYPVTTLLGVGFSAAFCATVEDYLAVDPISTLLPVEGKTVRQFMRGLTLFGGGCNAIGGIHSISTRPIDVQPSKTEWSWLFSSKPSLGVLRNSTGFGTMFNDKVEVQTIPGFSIFTLDPILRPHVGPEAADQFVSQLIADIGAIKYQGIFFHTQANGVLFLKLSDVTEVNPDMVASYNVSKWWIK